MINAGILSRIDFFPEAADLKQLEVRYTQWKENSNSLENKILKDFCLSVAENKQFNPILSSVFGNSSYLSQILLKEAPLFKDIMEKGFDHCFDHIISKIKSEIIAFDNTDSLMSAMRIAKNKVSLLVALADISGSWELEKVTTNLSIFAELCLKFSIQHLLKNAAKRGEISLDDINDPEKNSGLVVLAVGKLGSLELNYSSDIDIIVFFDESKTKYIGKNSVSHFFIQFTHELRRIIEDRTREGYVFRVDLRLRPDPGSTPAAISIRAAEIYYETLGQNWERAAMIKARPIAGDPESCNYIMKFLNPYIWRRSLDFDSIQDIHSIKRQIDNRHGKLPDNLHGYNVKLGRGGIREIEFFAQTQQLIWGGRKPLLRTSTTCGALRALASLREISLEACDQLISAYRFHRKVEHRLQMINDQQTHTLPDNPDDMRKFTTFLGYKNSPDFIFELTGIIASVQGHYSRLFAGAPSLASSDPAFGGSLVFTGSENDPETLKTLSKMGFSECSRVSETIRGWHHGRYSAMRSKRAREVLTEIMPSLLKSFSESAHPDMAFFKFDEFISKLPAGIQIFSLFYNNAKILSLMAEIMGGYPHIASNLNRNPALLEYVLAPEFYETLPSKEQLSQELAGKLSEHAKDLQDVLDITRNWAQDRQFRVGIQFIERKITTEETAEKLSDISDIVLSLILNYIENEFKQQHGIVKNGNFSIVAFGKLGSREMTFGSDLDLVFVYDAPDGDTISDGETPLGAGQYYMRLSRRFINAVSALTGVGKLYEVDLRLRPSGSDGPIATSLSAFDKYYGTSAWAWEYMALTKARVVAGEKSFQEKVMKTIMTKLRRKWDNKELMEGVLHMHGKVKENMFTSNIFDIKYVAGGLMDLEYISQFLQLKHAYDKSGILETNTKTSFHKFYIAGNMNEETAKILSNAADSYIGLLSILRLMGQDKPVESEITEGMKKILVRDMRMTDFDALKIKLIYFQKYVKNQFEKIILGK